MHLFCGLTRLPHTEPVQLLLKTQKQSRDGAGAAQALIQGVIASHLIVFVIVVHPLLQHAFVDCWLACGAWGVC